MVTFCLIAGLVLLFVGGEAMVRGAVGTARAFTVSPLLIGLTVVSMATSSPELLVSLQAAWNGSPDIAVGNVIGSNIANILLILGVGAVIATLPCERALIYRDGSFMVAGAILLVGLGFVREIEQWHGFAMMAALVAFIVYTFRTERCTVNGAAQVHESEADKISSPPGGMPGAVTLVVVGVGLLIAGAELLVYGATETARSLGVSEAVIGLSLVALGTSLPELASVAVAAWRGHTDVALGNVVGSNIFNVFAILGATSATTPVTVAPSFLAGDLWIMLAVSVLLIPLMLTGAKLSRIEGGMFLSAYALYIGWLYQGM